MQTPKPLSQEEIRNNLHTQRIGRTILILESASSTNDIAWHHAGQSEHDGFCVFAEIQTAGRGRRGRTWHSGKGESLLLSVLLQKQPSQADILTLVSAVAVAECLADRFSLNVQIKWPNDVLIQNKKVCGILTESRQVQGRPCFVIGIGINVHQKQAYFDRLSLDAPATSLALETHTEPDRNTLAAALLNTLDHWLCLSRYAPQQVADVWKRYNRQIGNQIRLLENQQEFQGTCLDMDPSKGLIVQLNHGPIRLFHASNCTVIPSETV